MYHNFIFVINRLSVKMGGFTYFFVIKYKRYNKQSKVTLNKYRRVMNNPILEHRQKVQERILKGFEDELEKAQYVHKYIRKEITKTGKTRYVYAESKNVERIKGNTRRYARKQLTWFKRDQQMKWFHPDEQEQIMKYISEYE